MFCTGPGRSCADARGVGDGLRRHEPLCACRTVDGHEFWTRARVDRSGFVGLVPEKAGLQPLTRLHNSNGICVTSAPAASTPPLDTGSDRAGPRHREAGLGTVYPYIRYILPDRDTKGRRRRTTPVTRRAAQAG